MDSNWVEDWLSKKLFRLFLLCSYLSSPNPLLMLLFSLRYKISCNSPLSSERKATWEREDATMNLKCLKANKEMFNIIFVWGILKVKLRDLWGMKGRKAYGQLPLFTREDFYFLVHLPWKRLLPFRLWGVAIQGDSSVSSYHFPPADEGFVLFC